MTDFRQQGFQLWARSPLVPFATAVAGGIAVSVVTPLLMLLAVFFLFTLILWGLSGRQRWMMLTLLSGFALLGSLRAIQKTAFAENPMQAAGTGYLALEGTLCGEVDTQPQFIISEMYDLRLHLVDGRDITSSAPVLVRLARTEATAVPFPGDRIIAWGHLEAPAPLRNSGGYDYAGALSRRGIYAVFAARHPADWRTESLATSWSSLPVRIAQDCRNHFQATLTRLMPPEEAQLLTGILLGAHGHLPPRLRDAFSDTGVAHIVTASGMNVGFVAWISLGLFRLLRFPRRLALSLTLPTLTFYTLVAGATPSLLRADIMLSVLLLGQLLDREASVANTVAFAALLLLLIDPLQLWDAGFQLSFAAVIGILAILPLMEPTAKRLQGLTAGKNRRYSRWTVRIAYVLLSAVALSFAAQISTAPLGAYYFNRLPLIGLLTNALVVPVLALLMTVGFTVWGMAILWLNAAQAVTAVVLRPLLTYIVGVVLICTNVPGAVLNVSSPPTVLIVLYYGLLAALLFWLHWRQLREQRLQTITFTDPYASEWEQQGA